MPERINVGKNFSWSRNPAEQQRRLRDEIKKMNQKAAEERRRAQKAKDNFRYKINPRARQAEKKLARIKTENQKRKRQLIEESNQLPLLEPDYPGEMHKMVNSRFSFKRNRLFQAEYNHEHPSKTGWGRWRNETREKIQPRAERAYINIVNSELAEAERQDNELPFQTNFFQQIDSSADK